MRRPAARIPSRSASLVLACVAGVALAAGLGGCDRIVPATFRAEAVTAGDGPIGPNEAIVIRFSRPLEDAPPPARSVLVRPAGGTPIALESEVRGRHLLLRPKAASGAPVEWPTEPGSVEVLIPYPIAGAGLRSRDGEAHAAGFRASVRVAPRRMVRTGRFRFLESDPVNGATGVDFATPAAPELPIQLVFDAPVDPLTLDAGIQIVDLARMEVLPGIPRRIDARDPRRVSMAAVSEGVVFGGGTRYEIRLTDSLRSCDGRSLLEPATITFGTRPERGNPRILRIDLGSASAFDAGSRPVFSPRGGVTANPTYHPILPPGSGTGLRSLGECIGSDAPQPFCAAGLSSRSQMIVPSAWLRPAAGADEDDPARFLVTAVDFHTTLEIPIDLEARELQVSLGHLGRRIGEGGDGLADRFDWNDDGGRKSRPVALRHRGGRLLLSPALPGGNGKPAPPGRILHLEFAEPFVYDAAQGDLVVGIRLEGGISSDQPHRVIWQGADLQGIPGDKHGPSTLVLGRIGETAGRGVPFQPYVWIHTLRIPPLVTRWHIVRDLESPRFFAPGIRALGDAREHEDFILSYQGGNPVLDQDGAILRDPDGAPRCADAGAWSADLPADGCRAIRIRIDFDPRLLLQNKRSADSGRRNEKSAEAEEGPASLPVLEALFVGYKGT